MTRRDRQLECPVLEIDALVAEAAALGPRIDALVNEWEELELEQSTLAPA